MTEITEPTLKLCLNEHAIRGLADAARKANLTLIAEQIEAQVQPEPTLPAEPTGDVVVFAAGEWFRRDTDGTWASDDKTIDAWSALLHKAEANGIALKVYRREPSPEAVEALVEKFATGYRAALRLAPSSALHEFAARLLGQPQEQPWRLLNHVRACREAGYTVSLPGALVRAEKLRELLQRWRNDRMAYPAGDPRAIGAGAAVKTCEAELRALLAKESDRG